MATLHVFPSTSDRRATVYKKRRWHSKTRDGCEACRSKRVKCDLQRPICRRCTRHDQCCRYDGQESRLLSICSPTNALSAPATTNVAGITDINLLQHCHQSWRGIFGRLLQKEMLDMTKAHPAVKSTMLALAASHLRHMSESRQYRIAEYVFQDLAIQRFQELLCKPLEVLGQSGMNALLLSAILLNMLAFTLPVRDASANMQTDSNEISLFEERRARLGWLEMQEGLRHLVRSAGKYLEPTLDFMRNVLATADEAPKGSQDDSNIPDLWIELFAFDENAQTDDFQQDVVEPALHALAKIPQPVGTFNLSGFLAPLLKFNASIRDLLYRGDERAIWLLSYWLASIQSCGEVWWCTPRAEKEYVLTRHWLRQSDVVQRPGREGEIWYQLVCQLDDIAPSTDSS